LGSESLGLSSTSPLPIILNVRCAVLPPPLPSPSPLRDRRLFDIPLPGRDIELVSRAFSHAIRKMIPLVSARTARRYSYMRARTHAHARNRGAVNRFQSSNAAIERRRESVGGRCA